MNYPAMIWGILIGIFLDLIFAFFSGSFSRGKKVFHLKIGDFKIHHSIIGAILILIYIFAGPEILFWIGLGIILFHSLRARRFLFVEYKRKKYF